MVAADWSIKVKGDMELSVYNDKALNLSCGITEMSVSGLRIATITDWGMAGYKEI